MTFTLVFVLSPTTIKSVNSIIFLINSPHPYKKTSARFFKRQCHESFDFFLSFHESKGLLITICNNLLIWKKNCIPLNIQFFYFTMFLPHFVFFQK